MVLKHIVLCALLLGTSVLLSTAAPLTDAIVPETELADPTPAPTATDDADDETAAPAPPPVPEVKVTFDHYINETPPPASDVPVAPGAAILAFGVDRYDGLVGGQNIFQWSYDRYLASRYKFDSGKIEGMENDEYYDVKGHEGEINIDGDSYMVPDQLTMQGPSLMCESASQTETEVVKSSKDMEKAESKGYSLGAEGEVKGVEAGMQYGSSEEAREYESSKNAGEDVSIFASVKARAYQAQLTGYDGATAKPLAEKDLSESFKGAVTLLGTEPTDDALRAFVLTFGTDFMTHTFLGGKVSQQTSMKTSDYSDEKSASLQKESSTNLNLAFASVGSSKSSSSSNSNGQSTSTTGEVHTAKFVGGIPNEDFMEWCASVVKVPAPIEFRIKPISDLIRDIWHSPEKAKVADALETFVTVTRKNEMGNCGDGYIYNKVDGTCDEAQCPEGTSGVTTDKGENTEKCEPCPAGYFGKGGENMCMPCAAGTYSAERAESCTKCKTGTTSDAGSAECSYIATGKYSIACTDCGISDGTTRYLTETDAGKKGDHKDLKEDTERWSYWSTSSTKALWITHVSASLYRISNTAESRSLVTEAGGDKDKGDAKYWAKFTPDRSDDFTITCDDWPKTDQCRLSSGNFAAVESSHGDNDIPSGGKWIAFREKDWQGTLKITSMQ